MLTALTVIALSASSQEVLSIHRAGKPGCENGGLQCRCGRALLPSTSALRTFLDYTIFDLVADIYFDHCHGVVAWQGNLTVEQPGSS